MKKIKILLSLSVLFVSLFVGYHDTARAQTIFNADLNSDQKVDLTDLGILKLEFLKLVGDQIFVSNSLVPKTNSYRGQLHCHTTNSDGLSLPQEVMTFYKNSGYNFVAITDHNNMTPDPGVPGILHIQSQEETFAYGHMNAFNIKTRHYSPGLTPQQLIDFDLADGGEVGLNHANYGGAIWTDEEIESLRGFKFMEIYNGKRDGTADAYALGKWDNYLSKGYKVWGYAADDGHIMTSVYSNRGWVMVNADTLSTEAVIKSMTEGNFYSSRGPSLSISVSGNTITAATDTPSSIKWIKKNGTVIKTTPNLTSDTYTAVGDEMYVRIEIIRSDGKQAWSQPIFVTLTNSTDVDHDGQATIRDIGIMMSQWKP